MRIPRWVTGVVASGCLALATLWVLGPPDPGHALPLFTSAAAVQPSPAAAVGLVAWLGVVVLAAFAAVDTASAVTRRARSATTATARSWVVLGVGVVILAAGITRDVAGYHVCCGGAASLEEVVSGGR